MKSKGEIDYDKWISSLKLREEVISSPLRDHLPLNYFQKRYNVYPFNYEAQNIEIDSLDLTGAECVNFSGMTVRTLEMAYTNQMPALFDYGNGLVVQVRAYKNPLFFGTVNIFFSVPAKERADKLLEKLVPVNFTNKQPKIHYIVYEGQLQIREAIIPLVNLELDYYNDGFDAVDKKMKTWLSDKTTRGLSILWGKTGTGKTFYLRHLASEIENLTYVPSQIADNIGSPDFLGFLSRQEERTYIIEDAENAIVSDGRTRSSGLNNLLNATDGLMGDIIKAKFILTFNTDIDNVDTALIRKGRAKVVYKFEPLSLEKTQALIKKKNVKMESPEMTLGDIFNAEENGADVINPQTSIGF